MISRPGGRNEEQMKSTAKVVSIILPCRNADPVLLGRAVDSVLAQTFAEYELLILDDGSDEDFQESLRAEAAKDGRIRLIRQEPSGVSAARNQGIREAEGEYITLLDADDTVSAWFLEEAVEAARKLKADFVIGGTCYIYDGQSVPVERGAEGLDPVKDAVLLSRERISKTRAECIGEPYRFDSRAYINRGIAARLVRRELLTEEFLFPEKLRIAEDASWNLTIECNFRGFYVPSLWYYYWENGKSVSNRYNPGVIKDMEDHLEVIRGQMDLSSDIEYRAFMDLMMDDLRYIYKCMVGNPQWQAGAAKRKEVLDYLYTCPPWREMSDRRYRRLASPRNRWKAELYRLRLLFAFWSLRKRV